MTHKVNFSAVVKKWGMDILVNCTGEYDEGRPAVMYLRNGDPGYPEEPAELNIQSLSIVGHGPLEGADFLSFTEEFYEELCDAAGGNLADAEEEEADAMYNQMREDAELAEEDERIRDGKS